MGSRYASSKQAVGMCDRCGFRFRIRELRTLIVKTKQVNVLVCRSCWEPDQPQLQVGMYPIDDPQAIRNPRPDSTYVQSGVNTLGYPGEGSRMIQWGWNPVGGAPSWMTGTENDLAATGSVGSVTITTT